MTAEEYFNKYEPLIIRDSMSNSKVGRTMLMIEIANETISDIDVNWEVERLKKSIDDANRKWNDICHMFETKYGGKTLNEDGVKSLWRDFATVNGNRTF